MMYSFIYFICLTYRKKKKYLHSFKFLRLYSNFRSYESIEKVNDFFPKKKVNNFSYLHIIYKKYMIDKQLTFRVRYTNTLS